MTEKGRFRMGGVQAVPYPENQIASQLLTPLPSDQEVLDASLVKRDQEFGKVKLSCTILSQRIAGMAYLPFGLFPTYCFNRENSILRFSTFSGGIQVTYDKHALFQGKVIAEEIAMYDIGKPVLKIHVQVLRGLNTTDERVFTPPAEAAAAGIDLVQVDSKVMAGKVLRKVPPAYPVKAKWQRTSGEVVLKALIGTDGRVHDLRVEKAPDPLLALASLQAVYQWVYQPYTLDGEPVGVYTTIIVVYKLGT